MSKSNAAKSAYFQSLVSTMTKAGVESEQIVQWLGLEASELTNQMQKSKSTEAATKSAGEKEN